MKVSEDIHPQDAAIAAPAIITDFEKIGQDTYEATLTTSEPNTPFERFKQIVLGKPIPETLSNGERLNRVRALAILSSDALSSVGYASEASLSVLIAAGAGALTANLGIGIITAVLMLIVGYSYRQTIRAYPNGGGSYIVARENLGVVPGLIAAGALLIDYLLTVSVSVSSGIDAIASAFPTLSPAKLAIELGAIVLLTLINLRGTRESGTIFAFPTFFFLFSFGAMIVFGVVHAVFQGGLTAAIHPAVTTQTTNPLSLFLILTAFASGCSAMTGVEAISNGVPVFEGANPPEQARKASQTLVIMVSLLVTFFLGTTFLAWRVGAIAHPSGDPTVTSQIAHFAFQGPFGWLFYIVQTATLLILVFAANTSFAGFPRLAAILARDTFMPAVFAYRGERIAFNVGIGTLGILSAIVLWIFNGSVTALINLYALGVFTAFTLSQTGMVIHWLRRKDEAGWRTRLIINAVGATATGIVTVVIALAKFDRGAWVVIVLVPLLVTFFLGVRSYYQLPRRILIDKAPKIVADIVVVPIFSHQDIRDPQTVGPTAAHPHRTAWPRVLEQELTYAASVAPKIVIVRVVNDQSEADSYCEAWTAYMDGGDPAMKARMRVEALISPYRTIVLPLSNFIRWQQKEEWSGKKIAIILPSESQPAWWEWPLQRRIATRVRQRLIHFHDKNVTLIDLPYTLKRG